MNTYKLFSLVIGLTISSSAPKILAPLMAIKYQSILFINIMISLHFCVVFGAVYFTMLAINWINSAEKIQWNEWKKWKELKEWRHLLPDQLKIIIIAGSTGSISSLLLMYASNPDRTPAVFQSIIPGVAVIPTAVLSFFLLKKQVKYNTYLIVSSILCQIGSVVILAIFVPSSWSITSIIWTIVYLFATILRCVQNIMQEKYLIESISQQVILTSATTSDFQDLITETDDENNVDLKRSSSRLTQPDSKKLNMTKITMIFYCRIVQFIVTLAFSWIDLFAGYSDNIGQNFIDSSKMFAHQYIAFLLFEGFIVSYLATYVFSVYTNEISTNYTIITSALTNPVLTIFFIIFPKLNTGITFPIYASIISVTLGVIGVILWIKGENNVPIDNTYLPINDKSSDE